MLPELGDVASPLLGLNNRTPFEGHPPKKIKNAPTPHSNIGDMISLAIMNKFQRNLQQIG